MKLFRIGFVVVACVVFSRVGAGRQQDGISVDTMPPVIVKTIPQAGATNVSPQTSEIRVTFSKDMMTERMWSFVKVSDTTFPDLAGEVHYLGDKRTCVLPVRLQPGRTYAMWLNSENNNAFRDRRNRPAVPYLLIFETR